MRRRFAALLLALLLAGFAACGKSGAAGQSGKSGDTATGETAAPADGETEAAPAPPTGMQRIIILNNAAAGLPRSEQNYNAKEYHKAYRMGEILDANLWFTPDEDASVQVTAYTDGYAAEYPIDVFRSVYVSLAKDNPDFDYDLFVGHSQKESEDVQYKGWCTIGREALLMTRPDGWNLAALFEAIGMADAAAYELTAVGGRSVTVEAADLADTLIEFGEKGADGFIAGGRETLENVAEIVPCGLTKDNAPAAGGVMRVLVLQDAEGVFGTEAPYSENRAGTWYEDCWSVADLLKKFDAGTPATVKIVSYKDGYSQDEEYELFAQKYMTYQEPVEGGTQKEFFTLGRAQARNAGVTNIGYCVLEETSFVFIPETGLRVAEAFAETGMCEAAHYRFTYADEKSETLSADEASVLVLDAGSSLLSIRAEA